MKDFSEHLVIWKGQPKQGVHFRIYDIFLIPVSLMWGGGAFGIPFFGGFFSNTNPTQLPNTTPSLFFLPFMLVGFYFIIGRFIHDYFLRKMTHYTITNDRIIIKSLTKTEEIYLGKWSCLKLQKFNDGTGTIVFSESSNFDRNAWLLPTASGKTQFYRINDPDYVFQLLNQSSSK